MNWRLKIKGRLDVRCIAYYHLTVCNMIRDQCFCHRGHVMLEIGLILPYYHEETVVSALKQKHGYICGH